MLMCILSFYVNLFRRQIIEQYIMLYNNMEKNVLQSKEQQGETQCSF